MSIHYQSIRCSCNYDQVPGAELASYLIRHNITNKPPNRYGKINSNFCWYPGTPQGIKELIAASNSLYLNRGKLFLHNARYEGWTECSASPNLQDENMIDALVIELPPLKKSKTGNDYSNIADLKDDTVRQLNENLEGYAHLKLPVLMLREKRGMGEEECSLLWEGKACDEGYSKEFVSVEFLFGDGSCLAKARGDTEVRFHKSNSGHCPQVSNNEEHQHPTTPNNHKETLGNTTSTTPSLWASYVRAKDNPATSSESKEHDTMRATIILTGDVHGHFLPLPCNQSDLGAICYRSAPYLASVISTVRSVEENVVLLDSGDAAFGSAHGETYENMELVADTMNLLQYDAMALGNHELDFGVEKLQYFLGLLKFPVLASNVLRLGRISTTSYAAISLGNNKHRNDTLCVVGITANEPNPMVKDLLIGPELDAVKDVLHDLSMNQQCSRLVILSHAGINVDRALANEFASDKKINVDAILGGHSHVLIPSPDISNESSEFGIIPVTDIMSKSDDAASGKKKPRPSILHTGANGRYVGLLRLEWNVSSNKMIKAETEILPLDEDHGVYPDHDFVKGLESRQKRINDDQRPEEGNKIQFRGISTNDTASAPLCGKPCRQGDCILGQLITDAMKACLDAGPCATFSSEVATRESKKDTISNAFAFLEAGTIRNCLHPTHQDFNEILPWPNKLVLLQVNGGLILKMLQHGLSTLSNNGGGFLQVSGLQYSYTKEQQIQHSICVERGAIHNSTTNHLSGDESIVQQPCRSALSPSLLDDDSSYWVVATDWLVAGGDGYGHLIDQASLIIETNVSIHEALSFYRASNPGLVYSTLPPHHHGTNLLQTHARNNASSNSAIAGFIGGALSFLLTFPIYAIFIKKAAGAPVVFSCRLFDGVWMGVLATALSNGIYFMIYTSEYLHLQPNWMRSFLAAVSNSIVTAPLWMLVTWQQLTVDQNSSSPLKTAKVIYKSRGVWGLFDSLPYNIIMCIHPTVRQVFLETIVGNSSFTFTGSTGIGIAASIASLLATIITYPIQKSRVVWQSSRQAAIRDIESGCFSIITCDMIGAYTAFLSGIGAKLALTSLNNFLLFFLMEEIDSILRYWRR